MPEQLECLMDLNVRVSSMNIYLAKSILISILDSSFHSVLPSVCVQWICRFAIPHASLRWIGFQK